MKALSAPRSEPLDLQSLLILHAAGELSDEQEDSLNRLLANDPNARALLSRARADMQRLDGVFSRAHASRTDDVTAAVKDGDAEEAAVAAANAAVRQWQGRRERRDRKHWASADSAARCE